MTPRDIAKWGRDLSGRSDAQVDAALQSLHCDPTERAAVRIEIEACRAERRISATGLATDQTITPGHMATDTSVTPDTVPLSPEMRVLFRKAGLDLGQSYSQIQVDDLLTKCGMGPTERMAVKAELGERAMLRAAAAKHVRASWDRDISAKAEPRGQILKDRQGRPVVLRSQPA